MRVRFNVKCRVDAIAYSSGDEAELDNHTVSTLQKLQRNGVPYVSVVEDEPAPEPKAKAKAKPKAKAKAKAKPKAKPKAKAKSKKAAPRKKAKKETATEV